MAAPVNSRPWRSLLIMALILAGLAVWALWPGGDRLPRLGLDLQGGTQVILVPRAVQEGAEVTDAQLQQTVEIIRQRVDGIGVAESEITIQGSGESAAIVVAVPGATPERVVELVGRTALLNFRPVWSIAGPAPLVDDTATQPSPDGSTAGNTIVQSPENDAAFIAGVDALDCLDPVNQAGGTPDLADEWLGTCDIDGAAKYALQPAFIEGTSITGASAQLPQQGVGGWVVTLEFDSEGASALSQASQELSALPECAPGGPNPCNAFAIVLDGVVVSAPRFNEPILGGQAQIEGDFTAEEANDLANILSYGALPVTLEVAEVTSVSATIGSDQLRAGLIAGGIGLVIIVGFLLLYYRIVGIVAVLSLGIAGAMTYLAVVALGNTIGFTLTLAGVAGAVIAIGITADSFIIYFERIRDELREGKSLRQAAEAGWVRARRTLIAADFVTLLAAIVLYILAVGNVRGFAFMLGLTTIVDVVMAFLFTHPLTVLLCRAKWMQRSTWLTGIRAKARPRQEPLSRRRKKAPAEAGIEAGDDRAGEDATVGAGTDEGRS